MKNFSYIRPRSIQFNIKNDVFSLFIEDGEVTLSANFLNERAFLDDGDALVYVKNLLNTSNNIKKNSIRVVCYNEDNIFKVFLIKFKIDNVAAVRNGNFEPIVNFVLHDVINKELNSIDPERENTIVIIERGHNKNYSYILYENKSNPELPKYIMELTGDDSQELSSFNVNTRVIIESPKIYGIFEKLKVKGFL